MHLLDESFWLAISFIIFLYIAYKPVKKAILNSLDTKIAEIKSQVLAAEHLRHDAVALLAQTKHELNNLDKLKEQILNEAAREANKVAAEQAKGAQLALEQQKLEALSLIAYQKTQSVQAIKQDFANLVVELATEYCKVSNDSLDFDIAKKFIRHANTQSN